MVSREITLVQLVVNSSSAFVTFSCERRWSPSVPCAISAMSSSPSDAMAASIIASCISSLFRSSTYVSARFAPRTCRSSLTASSFSGERPTRKSSAPSLAYSLAVSWAIAEVAPITSIFILKRHHFLHRFSRHIGGHAPPEARGEMRINVDRKFLPAREEGLEARRAHGGILGRIDRAAALQYDGIKFIEEAQSLWTAVGEIQRERQAGTRKGQHA